MRRMSARTRFELALFSASASGWCNCFCGVSPQLLVILSCRLGSSGSMCAVGLVFVYTWLLLTVGRAVPFSICVRSMDAIYFPHWQSTNRLPEVGDIHNWKALHTRAHVNACIALMVRLCLPVLCVCVPVASASVHVCVYFYDPVGACGWVCVCVCVCVCVRGCPCLWPLLRLWLHVCVGVRVGQYVKRHPHDGGRGAKYSPST